MFRGNEGREYFRRQLSVLGESNGVVESKVLEREKTDIDQSIDELHDFVSPKVEKIRIDESKVGLYDPDELERDLSSVVKKEESFKNKRENQLFERIKKAADVFEYLIYDLMKNHKFLIGNDNKFSNEVNMSSKYDDYYNGVDIFFKTGDPRMESKNIFLLDTTYARNTEDLIKKNWDLKNLTSGFSQSRLKYFDSEAMSDYKGKAIFAPRFIVGADRKQVIRLARAMYLGCRDDFKDENQIKRKINELESKVLGQLVIESRAMARVAKAALELNQDNDMHNKAEETYEKQVAACIYFNNLLNKKRNFNGGNMQFDSESVPHDGVHKAIMRYYGDINYKYAFKLGA